MLLYKSMDQIAAYNVSRKSRVIWTFTCTEAAHMLEILEHTADIGFRARVRESAAEALVASKLQEEWR